MKKTIFICIFVLILFLLSACRPATQVDVTSATEKNIEYSFTDTEGTRITLADAPQRVVCVYASYSDIWLSAGGTLVGVTDDAAGERQLDVGDAVLVGASKEPSLEKIASLNPDLVILSADIAGQLALKEGLSAMKIPAAYFTCDTFDDYKMIAELFLRLTGREDLQEQLITTPKAKIAGALARAEGKTGPTVLQLRFTSNGAGVKNKGTVAVEVLRDLGAKNIADDYPSLLEELSLEIILQADPEYIFVTALGMQDKEVKTAFEQMIATQPAWKSLSAVKNGKWFVLERELYHYKPNDRWGESYEKLAAILYP
ncbi:MAG: ABC transporter substrate-binding protein [Oscillospiraceae bacterium]|jgi:iron complex transport system substrate-binding protein|nr:ABC transporter substrate-binding protein [Oscillospiraceae bacterium]